MANLVGYAVGHAALVAAAIVGTIAIGIALFNRLHGRPLTCRQMRRRGRLLIAVTLAAVVTLIVAETQGGPLWDRPIYATAVVALSLGLLIPIAAVIRNVLHRERAVRERSATRTRVSDEARGDGSLAPLAKLPGNQLLEIELTRKTLAVRGGEAVDGLTILHLTDWHFSGVPDRGFYERAAELAGQTQPDLAIFSGDLIDRMDLLGWLPDTLGQIDARLGRFFVLGNHDWMQQPATIRTAVADLGWTDVAGRTVTVERGPETIELGGSERPWMGEEPAFASDGFRIAVTHTPDRLPWAITNGCPLALAGHNHGGQVRIPLLGPILSPSKSGTRYAGGVYERGGTALHVGRGLGALHPLRMCCRPEITLLTLVGEDS